MFSNKSVSIINALFAISYIQYTISISRKYSLGKQLVLSKQGTSYP